MTRAHVRWMIRRDMAEVLEIEHEAFEFPWSEEDFLQVVRQRSCISMVAELADKRIAGFMLYELQKTRLYLMNLAVAEWARRQQVGRTMVDVLCRKLSAQRRSRLVLDVRESNVRAQLFFRSLGFRAIGVKRGFYEDTPEDAYVFQWRVQQRAAQRPAS